MTTLELTISLPDELASKARAAGLLSSESMEKMLREQLRKQAGQDLLAMMGKPDADGTPPMSEEEVQAEISAYRAERRAKRGANS